MSKNLCSHFKLLRICEYAFSKCLVDIDALLGKREREGGGRGRERERGGGERERGSIQITFSI